METLVGISKGNAGQASPVAKWLALGRSDDAVLYSPVSVAELWAGARTSEYEVLRKLFAALICAPMDSETGKQAGDYSRLHRRSHGVELGDALIASAALLNRAVLWTRNRKHYPMKGLSFF